MMWPSRDRNRYCVRFLEGSTSALKLKFRIFGMRWHLVDVLSHQLAAFIAQA
jgi:hypothetical protein